MLHALIHFGSSIEFVNLLGLLTDQVNSVLVLVVPMESHEAGWHPCVHCRRYGMTADPIPEGVAIVTDVDWAGGLIYDPGYFSVWPPNYDYLSEILRTNESLAIPDILQAIAIYAYPVYAHECRVRVQPP